MSLSRNKWPFHVRAAELRNSSCLAFDRGLKARIYSHYGVRELWVIDAKQRRAHLHTGPKAGAWEDVVERGPQEVLTCAAVPGFSATLGAI